MALLSRIGTALRSPFAAARRYFQDQDPRFPVAFAPALLVSILLYVRSPLSNYIFDEQEALLANPYVNGNDLPLLSAFERDFWGLPPERSIGSYRPIPNLVWRLLWHVSHQPFIHHWVNVIGHAVNGALVAAFVFAASGRRRLAWLTGAVFLSAAVLTEAVSGVVGIADVLGGLGVLLALHALRLPLFVMPQAVLLAASFGLFSKESVIVAVPLVALAAFTTAPLLHPQAPHRLVRTLLSLVALVGALVLYTELRKKLYPVALPEALAAPLPPGAPRPQQLLHKFLIWFHQPSLPRDPINNPLVEAPFHLRVAAALRVYASGLGQVVFPWTLSGDYSFRAEPVPARPVFFGSVMGALLALGPLLVGLGVLLGNMLKSLHLRRAKPAVRRRLLSSGALLATGLLWFPIAYFPHSNIAVLLPTVRAERFWYLPVVGTSLVLGLLARRLLSSRSRRLGAALVGAFFGVQAFQARSHALDYMDDLSFWDATRKAVPLSAKAQLNYSVMLGARGDLKQRLHYNQIARELAPDWAMAHIYYGDTLCRLAGTTDPPGKKLEPEERLARAERAMPHYLKGFGLAPNDPNLIALALQCMWEEKLALPHRQALSDLADRHPGSWLSFLVTDILENGEKNGGVQKKYRPRSYDEGPKGE
ncbi:MAG TPA: tetratricopeptide repeat protein [Polyangiaceae bacterium]|nr:tetratricopeptide repeat protein [Polyangiaceae bacterium]